jgi:hypothetical protein
MHTFVSVVSCTVDCGSETASSSSKQNYYGEGGSHYKNHKRSNYETNLKSASGEFYCTLDMVLDKQHGLM